MPTNASEAEVKTMMSNQAGNYRRLRDILYLDSPSWRSREDTAYDNVEGQTGPLIRRDMAAIRASLSQALLNYANTVPRLLEAYAVAMDWGAGNRWQQLYEYWATQGTPVTVQSRDWTFGTATAGASNVGDGTIRRNVKDKFGYDIESGRDDTRDYVCIQDANSGTQLGAEVFAVTGTPVGPDLLDPRGLGIATQITGRTGLDTAVLVRNPSFGVVTVANSEVSSLSGWTPSDFSDLTASASDVYRVMPNETATFNQGYALIFKDNDEIAQKIRQTTKRPLRRDVPYYAQIAFKRQNSCDGTLVLKIGSQSVSVSLSAQTGWNVLTWKLDENAWYDNFADGDMDVRIKLYGRTTGELLVDDLIFVPMNQIGPRFETLIGGETAFETTGNDGTGDSLQIVDTVGNSDGAYMQEWANAIGVYFPASDSPTFTEPTP